MEDAVEDSDEALGDVRQVLERQLAFIELTIREYSLYALPDEISDP